MKKLLVLLGCVLFLTGCDVNYDLVIDEDSFDETVAMSLLKNQTSYDDLSIYLENKIPVTINLYETKFYDVDIIDDSNYYNLIYKFKHDSDSISNSYFISNCYPNFKIINTDNMLELSSGQEFVCFNGDDGLEADSVNINITTDMEVISSNADNVSGNTYTWNIDETNYNNKPINMQINKSENIENVIKEHDNSFTLVFIVVTVLVTMLVLYILIRLKTKKNNAF